LCLALARLGMLGLAVCQAPGHYWAWRCAKPQEHWVWCYQDPDVNWLGSVSSFEYARSSASQTLLRLGLAVCKAPGTPKEMTILPWHAQ
jgi:hypothetical protein